jgi:hypothetical protein
MITNRPKASATRWTLGGLVSAAALLITLVVPTAATAAPAEIIQPDTAPAYVFTEDQQRDVDAVAIASDEHARTFDVAVARDNGASEAGITDFAEVIGASGWTVLGDYDRSHVSDTARALKACAGASSYTGYHIPWGHQWALNSCETDTLIAGVKVVVAGGAATAAVALLAGKAGAPVALVAGAVAAIAGVGVAFLELCKTASSNDAIYVNVLGTPTASCWGQ